ncbi:hypothetical protein ACP70R_025421 [Stipagrostis hirtigluma subsp. patula]
MRRSVRSSAGCRVVIQAATLSAAPVPELTIAAALVMSVRVRPLNDIWQIICSGAIDLDDDENPLQAPSERRLFSGGQCTEPVLARYLVESRGELLLVVRIGRGPGLHWMTTGFRVFRMRQDQPHGGIQFYTWDELTDLGGRILFVSRGCSRSYELADHASFEEGVYFKADVPFWRRDRWNGLTPRQREILNEDCGFWSGPFPGTVTRCFSLPKQLDGQRRHSQPVWVFPRVG